MIRTLLLFLFFSACAKVGAQTLACTKITHYDSIRFVTYFQKKAYTSFRQDTVFLIDKFKLRYFTSKGEVNYFDLERLLGKADKKAISTEYSFSYLHTGNLFIIQSRAQVFLFEFTQNEVKFLKRITLQNDYGKHIYYYRKKLFFYGIYNYHEKDNKLNAGYLMYDLKTDQEIIHHFPFSYLSLTHFTPNHFIDFSNTGYIVADPFRYTLYEYSFDNRLKDSLCAPDSVFTRTDGEAFSRQFPHKKISLNPSSYLSEMSAYLDSTDRIWTVNYIDSITLFVRLTRNSLNSSEKKRQLFFDHIWQKKEGRWQLIQVKDLRTPDISRDILASDLWPHFFPGSKYTCVNGSLYYSFWGSGTNFFPQNGESFFGFDVKDRQALSLKTIEFKFR